MTTRSNGSRRSAAQSPLVIASALIACAIAVLAITTPSPAAAAVGGWTKLSATTGGGYPRISNIDEPTLGRLGADLQVVWPVQATASSAEYQHAIVSRDGQATLRATPILTGWAELTADPRLITVSGAQFLAFSGLRSTDTADPYAAGAEYFATSADGRTWDLGTGSLSESTSAYASYGNDAVDNAGTPVWVGNPGTVTGIRWQSGTTPTIPSPTGTDGSLSPAGCCAYSAAAARDASTGAVIAAFYSNSNDAAEQGIQVGQILPSLGAFARAPGSVTMSGGSPGSLSPDQRVAMVSRPGGGVLVAYKVGYPSTSRIRVWQAGTTRQFDIPGSSGARRISMAAEPGGQVWVTWITGDQVKSARLNASGVVPRSTISWAGPPQTSTLWKVGTSSGSAKRLDVIITASGGGGSINVWHRQAVRR
ncbi:MAG: hypothetical protein F2836_00105 [Actinobacteria bacterium]|uniref:Unannotated protein n=1 Tax=freshwater metagenome TaxID=449393 RepID=A0A6J7HIQ5_9ZZZZ|nr:hypothetical protein [Actinomycetota bacterium]